MQLLLSMVAAVTLGTCALLLYSFSYCWDGGTDCAAYSPTRRWIAFLLAPPVFAMQGWFFGTVDNVANFDPVIFGKCGWLALWAYYLGLITTAVQVRKRWRARQRK